MAYLLKKANFIVVVIADVAIIVIVIVTDAVANVNAGLEVKNSFKVRLIVSFEAKLMSDSMVKITIVGVTHEISLHAAATALTVIKIMLSMQLMFN